MASPAVVEAVFAAGRVLVWAEAGIDTAAHLLDMCPAPAEAVEVDIPAGRAAEVVDILAGIVVVVDLAEAQP